MENVIGTEARINISRGQARAFQALIVGAFGAVFGGVISEWDPRFMFGLAGFAGIIGYMESPWKHN